MTHCIHLIVVDVSETVIGVLYYKGNQGKVAIISGARKRNSIYDNFLVYTSGNGNGIKLEYNSKSQGNGYLVYKGKCRKNNIKRRNTTLSEMM